MTATLENYEIGAAIRRGALGDLRRGVDITSGQSVMIQFVPADPARGDEWVGRLRSAHDQILGSGCANILPLREIVVDTDGVTIVTELADGANLGDILDATGPMSASRAVEIAGQVLAALEGAHAVGLVHGGLSSDNVYLAPDDRVWVTDFAMSLDTATENMTAADDVYAVGALLHQMILGSAPAFDDTAELVRSDKVSDELSTFLAGLLAAVAAERPAAGVARRQLASLTPGPVDSSDRIAELRPEAPEPHERLRAARGLVALAITVKAWCLGVVMQLAATTRRSIGRSTAGAKRGWRSAIAAPRALRGSGRGVAMTVGRLSDAFQTSIQSRTSSAAAGRRRLAESMSVRYQRVSNAFATRFGSLWTGLRPGLNRPYRATRTSPVVTAVTSRVTTVWLAIRRELARPYRAVRGWLGRVIAPIAHRVRALPVVVAISSRVTPVLIRIRIGARPSRRVRIGLAAGLTLAVVAVGTVAARVWMAAPAPDPGVTYAFAPASYSSGLNVTRRWTLTGASKDRSKLVSSASLTNPTGAALSGSYDVVVPESVASDASMITFDPAPSAVLRADPVVRYSFDIAPGAIMTIGYSVAVSGSDSSSAARLALLTRLASDQDSAQTAWLQATGQPAPATLSQLSVSPAAVTLAVGQSTVPHLSGTMSDGSAANATLLSGVVWSSSDDRVAKFSDPNVVAVGPGDASLTAQAGPLSAVLAVTVQAPPSGSIDATTVNQPRSSGSSAKAAQRTSAPTTAKSSGVVPPGAQTTSGAGSSSSSESAGRALRVRQRRRRRVRRPSTSSPPTVDVESANGDVESADRRRRVRRRRRRARRRSTSSPPTVDVELRQRSTSSPPTDDVAVPSLAVTGLPGSSSLGL